MKKRRFILAFTLVGLAAVCAVLFKVTHPPTPVAARPVRLVITGPEGQRFSGSYAADGVTNSVTAVAPAVINVLAKDVGFEFKRQGGNGEFRVAMFVGEQCRTSTTSDQRDGVRGQLRYGPESESYWSAGF